MALAAIDNLQALIDGKINQLGNLANGMIAENHTRPMASYIDEWMFTTFVGIQAPAGAFANAADALEKYRAVVTQPPPGVAQRQLVSIAKMASLMSGAYMQVLPADRPSIKAAVAVAMARYVFFSAYPLEMARTYSRETRFVDQAQVTIHLAHQQAVHEAMELYFPLMERFLGVAVYNAITMARTGHHHLPRATRKLASTTISLSPVAGDVKMDPTMTNAVFHDAYHSVSNAWFSLAARSVAYSRMAQRLGYTNLEKRVPVKAPDTALAMNYVPLHTTAMSYVKSGAGVIATYAPTNALLTAIRAYREARANQVVGATQALQAAARELMIPSAYMAGYILGKLRRQHDMDDMTLKDASTDYKVTILGSPALTRITGSGAAAGAFDLGISQGKLPSSAAESKDHIAHMQASGAQILLRCNEAIARNAVPAPQAPPPAEAHVHAGANGQVNVAAVAGGGVGGGAEGAGGAGAGEGGDGAGGGAEGGAGGEDPAADAAAAP